MRRGLVVGIDRDGRAADVIAVQTVAGIAVEFRLVPRTEHDAGLRAGHGRLRVAGILRCVAKDMSGKDVLADADRSAQPVGPACGAVHPYADIALLHAVVTHGREHIALLGLEQADMNVVVTALHADSGLRLKAAEPPIEGMARVKAAEGAAIELVELVAIDRVVEEIGEIVEELQVGAHGIGADFGLAVFA